MELIKTISSRVGTLRLAELRPLMRFPQFVACSRLHGRKKFLFPPFRRTMFFCCAKSGSIIRSRTVQKETSAARVGTVRSRVFRTPRAFDGKFRVLPTSQSAAAARRCGCYGEPSFCCAKSGPIIRSRPKHKQTSFRMSERCKRRGWVLCISHFFDR